MTAKSFKNILIRILIVKAVGFSYCLTRNKFALDKSKYVIHRY